MKKSVIALSLLAIAASSSAGLHPQRSLVGEKVSAEQFVGIYVEEELKDAGIPNAYLKYADSFAMTEYGEKYANKVKATLYPNGFPKQTGDYTTPAGNAEWERTGALVTQAENAVRVEVEAERQRLLAEYDRVTAKAQTDGYKAWVAYMDTHDVPESQVAKDNDGVYSLAKWRALENEVKAYPTTHAGERHPLFKKVSDLNVLNTLQAFGGGTSGSPEDRLTALAAGFHNAYNDIARAYEVPEQQSALLAGELITNTVTRLNEIMADDKDGVIMQSPLYLNLKRTIDYRAHYVASISGKSVNTKVTGGNSLTGVLALVAAALMAGLGMVLAIRAKLKK